MTGVQTCALPIYSNLSKQGFIRLSLATPQEAFGHKLYPKVYAERVVAMTKAEAGTIEMPNEPYTPQLGNFSLSYDAVASLKENEDSASTNSQSKQGEPYFSLYHLTPFGCKKMSDSDSDSEIKQPLYLVPQFEAPKKEDKNEELNHNDINAGELYLGISNATPPQIITLFFKVAEGSENPERNKEPVYFSVLNDNQWQPLVEKDIVKDSTNGLTRSGIVALSLPKVSHLDSTLMPTGKLWLRVTITSHTDAVCRIQTITTQVGEASFAADINTVYSEDFLATPLPENTISKLVKKQAQIKAVSQPYAATEGKAPESSSAFNRRVSERLRHKDRAITIWDYEHLVLQAFDDIYKAKCINHTTYLYPKTETTLLSSEFAPGYVSLIVIPNLKNQNAIDPLQPRLSLDRLDNIHKFLKQRVSPFVAEKIKVINPLYEQIQLEFNVHFRDGYDPAMYKEILNQDLLNYLSPWAFDHDSKHHIQFGGTIYRSTLVNFIEERDYVDHLTLVKMHLLRDNLNITATDKSKNQFDIEQAHPSSARSIFVSHPQHVIKTDEVCT